MTRSRTSCATRTTGIETPDARKQAGEGRARLRARVPMKGGQVIEIVDDGRGIQVEKVVKKASSVRCHTGGPRCVRLSPRATRSAFIFAPGFDRREGHDPAAAPA